MQSFQIPPPMIEEERTRPIRFIKIMLFSASIIPTLVAGALAYADGYSNFLWLILAGIGLFVGQAGGDYLYYYFTHFHTDTRDAHTKIFAGWKPLFAGRWIKNEHTLVAGIVCLLFALVIGIYFYLQLGAAVIILALAGGLIAIFFTPLMMRGFKEPVVFLTFGPLSMLGIDFVLTQQFRVEPLIASLPVGFLVTLVAYLKGAHYRIVEDSDSSIILNLKPATAATLLTLAYFTLIAGAFSIYLEPEILLGLLTLPFAVILVKKLQTYKKIADYLWATVYALLVFITTGLLMSSGLLISAS
jgi:1,4-dihydroxy-2-naphthoate octaprenyltransferase